MKKFLSVFLLLCAAFSVESWATDVPIPNPSIYLYGDAVTGTNTPIVLFNNEDGVYEFKGELKAGGSFKFFLPEWDSAEHDWTKTDRSINAATANEALSKEGLDLTFTYPATQDNYWKVAPDAGGYYTITVNIKDKKVKAEYKGTEFSSILPLYDLYIYGNATATEWDIQNAAAIQKCGENVYRYTGDLKVGQFRFLTTKLSPFALSVKPAGSSSVDVNTSGFSNGEVAYCREPDISWNVTEAGKYRITLDLNSMTVKQEKITPDPGIYVIGGGLPNSTGWSTVTPIGLTKINDNIYKYIGHLDAEASIKFLLKKAAADASDAELWAGPFIKAPSPDYPITKTDMENVEFLYNPSSDYNFKVADAGYYELTLDIDAFTISSHYLGESFSSMCSLIDNIYIYGPAANSKSSWELSDAAAIKKIDDTHYQYMGHLNGGGDSYPQFRFMTVKDFDALSLKPANKAGAVLVTKNGMSETGVDYRLNPDKNWNVQDDGYYTLNLDLQNMAISATDYMAELPTSATAVADNGTSEYYATFSNIYSDMELSVETGTIEVYNVKVSGDKLDLIKREGTKVACGEGVLVKASTPTITVTPVSDEALTPAVYRDETLLVATPVSAKTVTADGDYSLYRLTFSDANNQTGLGFYYGSDDGKSLSFSTPQPNKAYLKVPSTMAAQIKGFSLNPHPTHVEGINAEEQSNNEPIYDLSGRRVENPTKGFYLQGNKKIIVK